MSSSPSIRRVAPRALAAAVLLALGACATHPPAPIVSRTTPGAAGAARPAPGAPPATAPVPAPAATPAPAAVAPPPPVEAPAVETAPVRSGAIESRGGIESRPLPPAPSPAPSATTVTPTPPAPALPPNTRTGPRGTKVPFTDSAIADLRAAEGTAPAATPPAVPGVPVVPAAPPAAAGAGSAPAAGAAGAGASAGAAPAAPRPGEPAAPDAAARGDWIWPSSGRVIQTFDQTSSKGIALGGKTGDPVLAAADGRVIFSGNGPRGYGNLVIVKHANDLLSVYAHNRTLSVKEGQDVKRGQKIAELGDSGTTSPRLHFEIRQQGKPVDPTRFLPRR